MDGAWSFRSSHLQLLVENRAGNGCVANIIHPAVPRSLFMRSRVHKMDGFAGPSRVTDPTEPREREEPIPGKRGTRTGKPPAGKQPPPGKRHGLY